jgi:predicted PurR-regulated permease PerM
METFGIVGMTFGIISFVFAMVALTQSNSAHEKLKELREEMDRRLPPPEPTTSA